MVVNKESLPPVIKLRGSERLCKAGDTFFNLEKLIPDDSLYRTTVRPQSPSSMLAFLVNPMSLNSRYNEVNGDNLKGSFLHYLAGKGFGNGGFIWEEEWNLFFEQVLSKEKNGTRRDRLNRDFGNIGIYCRDELENMLLRYGKTEIGLEKINSEVPYMVEISQRAWWCSWGREGSETSGNMFRVGGRIDQVRNAGNEKVEIWDLKLMAQSRYIPFQLFCNALPIWAEGQQCQLMAYELTSGRTNIYFSDRMDQSMKLFLETVRWVQLAMRTFQVPQVRGGKSQTRIASQPLWDIADQTGTRRVKIGNEALTPNQCRQTAIYNMNRFLKTIICEEL